MASTCFVLFRNLLFLILLYQIDFSLLKDQNDSPSHADESLNISNVKIQQIGRRAIKILWTTDGIPDGIAIEVRGETKVYSMFLKGNETFVKVPKLSPGHNYTFTIHSFIQQKYTKVYIGKFTFNYRLPGNSSKSSFQDFAVKELYGRKLLISWRLEKNQRRLDGVLLELRSSDRTMTTDLKNRVSLSVSDVSPSTNYTITLTGYTEWQGVFQLADSVSKHFRTKPADNHEAAKKVSTKDDTSSTRLPENRINFPNSRNHLSGRTLSFRNINAIQAGERNINITWEIDGTPAGVKIEVRGDGKMKEEFLNGSQNFLTISDLLPDRNYRFTLRSYIIEKRSKVYISDYTFNHILAEQLKDLNADEANTQGNKTKKRNKLPEAAAAIQSATNEDSDTTNTRNQSSPTALLLLICTICLFIILFCSYIISNVIKT